MTYSLELLRKAWPEQVMYEQALLAIIKLHLTRILEKWNELLAHLNTLLADRGQATFMNPDSYVHLLYDESTFSRSKFYFWAIGCLSSFEENIVINARHLKSVRRKLVNKVCRKLELEQVSSEHTDHIKMLDAELEPLCKQLEDIGEQFGKRLETVRTLRDGLFNASGVMETRQSRVLGENVRLLTFVSIFFLPLAFCVEDYQSSIAPATQESDPVVVPLECSSYLDNMA
ncbi:hypothetical protein HYFRA_00006899 [Hymenoscyphus fraxineus]|uniref:Uncharacterized protein n=1 Tax=Hymenoscyphus fraxineus TaxID=746836 RepID=A0A9N9PKW4_9HELO|nr:hypothetical protein HYFRA_00006899 [Hymenoscyphus fraxineus]